MNTIDDHDLDAAVRRSIDLGGAGQNTVAEGQLEQRLLKELAARENPRKRHSCASRSMTDTITSDAGRHHEACRTPSRGMSDSITSDAGHF